MIFQGNYGEFVTNAVSNGSFISYFSPIFIHSSWNFHSSRYHPLLFHPYHAHEVVPRAHEHALDPNPRNGGNEDMTAMEYCLNDGIWSFTPRSFSRYPHVSADAFHRQPMSLQGSIHGCLSLSFNAKIPLVLVVYDARYGKIFLRIINGCSCYGIIDNDIMIRGL